LEEEIPDWAGLLYVSEGRGRYASVSQIVKAPQLHRAKADPALEAHMRGVCYYRMLNFVLKAGRLSAD
jgi:hypothetical protein